MLDGVGAARLGIVGIEPELALRPSLPQQVPAAVERDPDLLEPGAVAVGQVAVALALVQRLLLGDQLVDPAQNLAVVHPSLLSGPGAYRRRDSSSTVRSAVGTASSRSSGIGFPLSIERP